MAFIISQTLDTLLKRWQKSAHPRRKGIIYGIDNAEAITALMCAFCENEVLSDREALHEFLDSCGQAFPTGLVPVGMVTIESQGDQLLSDFNRQAVDLIREKVPSHIRETVLATVGSYARVSENFAVFYHCAPLESALTPIHNKLGIAKALEFKIVELQIEDRNGFMYGIDNGNLILSPETSTVLVKESLRKNINKSSTVGEYMTAVNKVRAASEPKTKPAYLENLVDITNGVIPMEPVEISLLRNSANSHKSHGSSPMLIIGEGATNLVRFQIKSFMFVGKGQPLLSLMELAELAKRRQLAAMADFLKRNSENESPALCCPVTYHIVAGPNIVSIVTAGLSPAAPGKNSFLDELQLRYSLDDVMSFSKHGSLESRRLFTKLNHLNVGERLLAKNSGSFYPYVLSPQQLWNLFWQDRFDDEGWGCAYRSLQTIFSWYKLQGHTEHALPSHDQIQRVLVEVKDRNKSLIGSKQWIGAMEISRVLDHLLGVQCKIVNVSSGRELGTAFAGLKQHFETVGTPVMIGGGVYAYTLVGVAINRASGEVKVMVVDPHYVGEDDMDLVLRKNGVAWQTPEFWDQNAFYNLCCPLRL